MFSQRVGGKDMVCIADVHQQIVLSPRKREREIENLTCLSMLPWEHGMCDTAGCTEVDEGNDLRRTGEGKKRAQKKVGYGGVDLCEAARVASLLQLSCV